MVLLRCWLLCGLFTVVSAISQESNKSNLVHNLLDKIKIGSRANKGYTLFGPKRWSFPSRIYQKKYIESDLTKNMENDSSENTPVTVKSVLVDMNENENNEQEKGSISEEFIKKWAPSKYTSKYNDNLRQKLNTKLQSHETDYKTQDDKEYIRYILESNKGDVDDSDDWSYKQYGFGVNVEDVQPQKYKIREILSKTPQELLNSLADGFKEDETDSQEENYFLFDNSLESVDLDYGLDIIKEEIEKMYEDPSADDKILPDYGPSFSGSPRMKTNVPNFIWVCLWFVFLGLLW